MTGYVKWGQAVTAEVTLSGLQQQLTFITSHVPEVGSTRAAKMGGSKACGLPGGFGQGLGWSHKRLRPGCSLPQYMAGKCVFLAGWGASLHRSLGVLRRKLSALRADSPGQKIGSGLLCPSLELHLHSATFHLLESRSLAHIQGEGD